MMKLAVKILRREDGTYSASCPSLPGCATRGQTREEAQEKIEDAILGYLAAVGDFVPDKVVQEPIQV